MDATFFRFWVGDFQLCPRNLTLLGPFGGFYRSINASESVYDSISVPSRAFLSSTQPQGYTFIPIVSNQMIKIRREIFQRS